MGNHPKNLKAGTKEILKEDKPFPYCSQEDDIVYVAIKNEAQLEKDFLSL